MKKNPKIEKISKEEMIALADHYRERLENIEKRK
jgi:hypothetical protein